jgi:hypothetical protein
MTPRKSRKKRLVGWTLKGWEKDIDQDALIELLGAFSKSKPYQNWAKHRVKVRITIEEITPLNK